MYSCYHFRFIFLTSQVILILKQRDSELADSHATDFAIMSQDIASIYKDIGKEWKKKE